MMVDVELAEWLLERIAEDEDRDRLVVRLASQMYEAWQAHNPHNPLSFDEQAEDVREEYLYAAGEVVARNMPLVLAECEAKRLIIAEHSELQRGMCQCMADYPCTTLKLVALPFAGRDGYLEEWKP